MSKKITIISFLILLTTMFFIFISNNYAAGKTVAKVKLVRGNANFCLKNSKDFSKLKINQALKEGATIRTGNNSKVTLKFLNGSLIELKSNSELSLNSTVLKQSSVSLLKGGAHFNIQKLLKKDHKFNVYTPTAVAGIRGTEYDIEIADDGSSIFDVDDGKVAVDNGSSDTVLSKKQSAEADLGNKNLSKGGPIKDTGKWADKKNKNINKDPEDSMKSVNENMDSAYNKQKNNLNDLSKVKNPDAEKDGDKVTDAEFNKCKAKGLNKAAKKIRDKNKNNKRIQELYNKNLDIYTRFDKVNLEIDQRFDHIEQVYQERVKQMDKKYEDNKNKFDKKYDKYKK